MEECSEDKSTKASKSIFFLYLLILFFFIISFLLFFLFPMVIKYIWFTLPIGIMVNYMTVLPFALVISLIYWVKKKQMAFMKSFGISFLLICLTTLYSEFYNPFKERVFVKKIDWKALNLDHRLSQKAYNLKHIYEVEQFLNDAISAESDIKREDFRKAFGFVYDNNPRHCNPGDCVIPYNKMEEPPIFLFLLAFHGVPILMYVEYDNNNSLKFVEIRPIS